MLEGLPKWGKFLVLFSGMVFSVTSFLITKQNFQMRKDGDLSERKFTEIIVGATMTAVVGTLTIYLMWELAD